MLDPNIVGIDEVGRGALAGPVVSAAVALSPHFPAHILKDSKQLSAEKREAIFSLLLQDCRIGVGIVASEVIDQVNIFQATLMSMKEAALSLKGSIDLVIVDGIHAPQWHFPTKTQIKADQEVPQVSAASIVAKVLRDQMMAVWDQIYPEYYFSVHKGYGTQRHYNALFEKGILPIHRRSFNLHRQESLFLETT